jgi:hypothetical protein
MNTPEIVTARPTVRGKIGLAVLMLLPATNLGRAQSWVLPAGEGSVSFTYQALDNTGRRIMRPASIGRRTGKPLLAFGLAGSWGDGAV